MRIVLVVVAALVAASQAADEKKVVCYYGSWSEYRPSNGKFEVSNIDPTLCTHLIYSFLRVDPSGDVIIHDPKDNSKMDQFNRLREQSPNTKTLIAIGGWTEGCGHFSPAVADSNTRRRFVDNIVAFVKKHGFDGFDVDWEYPGCGPADKQNLVSFLRELRERFDQDGLILSAAVGATEYRASQSYDISGIAKYLDFINIMTYDMHGGWESKTGLHSPLYPRSSESGAEATVNIDSTIKYWISHGAPAEKLILGVPFYGKTFKLANPQSNGVGAPASGAAPAGPYSGEEGLLSYNEICEKIQFENWEEKFDEEQRVPYAFHGNQWVGFDNERSLKEKTDYVKKYGLGGAMVWAIDNDDFSGKCGEKYPLLNTLNRELRNGAPSSNSPPRPSQTHERPKEALTQGNQQYEEPNYQPQWQQQQQQQQQYVPSNEGEICQTAGNVRDPTDCKKYYLCHPKQEGGFYSYSFQCPLGTAFDSASANCDHEINVQCW